MSLSTYFLVHINTQSQTNQQSIAIEMTHMACYNKVKRVHWKQEKRGCDPWNGTWNGYSILAFFFSFSINRFECQAYLKHISIHVYHTVQCTVDFPCVFWILFSAKKCVEVHSSENPLPTWNLCLSTSFYVFFLLYTISLPIIAP